MSTILANAPKASIYPPGAFMAWHPMPGVSTDELYRDGAPERTLSSQPMSIPLFDESELERAYQYAETFAWGPYLNAKLTDVVIDRLRGESPRSMTKLLSGAARRAVMDKRGTLKPEDVRGSIRSEV